MEGIRGLPRRARLEARREQSIGLDRDLRVRRFHREHDVVIVLRLADIEKLEGALDHALRRVAEAIHDPIGERAVIRPDSHRDAVLATAQHERPEALRHALELGGVLHVVVLPHLELLLVGVIARVDPDLLDDLGRDHRGVRREVYVGDERHTHALGRERLLDLPQILGVANRGRRESHDLAARAGKRGDLGDRRRGVHRVGIRHRLDADRMIATDGDVPNPHDAGSPAPRREGIADDLHPGARVRFGRHRARVRAAHTRVMRHDSRALRRGFRINRPPAH